MDTAGVLSAEESAYFDAKLDRVRRKLGFEIVVFLAGSLDNEPIDDVAYKAFNTWKLGQGGKDNGVLFLIAPKERQVRIETGKGVGGALTDLQSNDILRTRVTPFLKSGRYREAVNGGIDGIVAALAADMPDAPDAQAGDGDGARRHHPRGEASPVSAGMIALFLIAIIVLAIVSPGFRSLLWMLFIFGGRGGRGGGGGGGSGGSGYSGGSGSSGGGGSSDSY